MIVDELAEESHREEIAEMKEQIGALTDALEALLATADCKCGDRKAGHLANCRLFDAQEALRKVGRLS